jgi:phosphohistidine phosphatase
LRLLLFRHGPAEDRETWRARGGAEARRPLTADGRRRTRAAARGLARLVEAPERVATSPLTRARQTADVLARSLGAGDPEVQRFLAPSAAPDAAIPWLSGRAAAGDRLVAVVGHEPHLGKLASLLLAGEGSFVRFRKAGAALLDLGSRPGPGKARLEWLLEPSALRRLGRQAPRRPGR